MEKKERNIERIIHQKQRPQAKRIWLVTPRFYVDVRTFAGRGTPAIRIVSSRLLQEKVREK